MTLPPDPEHLNKMRAEQAEAAIKFFHQLAGESGKWTRSSNTQEVAMGDLLCNMAHLCDRRGVAMADVLRRAVDCYTGETAGQGMQFGGSK